MTGSYERPGRTTGAPRERQVQPDVAGLGEQRHAAAASGEPDWVATRS